MEIIKELIDFKEKLTTADLEYNSKENHQFIQKLLDFHFMYLFEEKIAKYNVINEIETPFIYESDFKKIIEKLDQFIVEINDKVGENLLYEFEVLKDYFEENKFSGLQILYLGGITLLDTKTHKDALEIDSLILRPNKLNEDFIHILEAKNIAKGESVVQSQLESNSGNGLNINEVIHEVELLSKRNTIAKVSVNRVDFIPL